MSLTPKAPRPPPHDAPPPCATPGAATPSPITPVTAREAALEALLAEGRAALGAGLRWWATPDEDGSLQIGAVPHLARAAAAVARLLSELVSRQQLPPSCEEWAASALRVSQWEKQQASPPRWNPRPACLPPQKTPPHPRSPLLLSPRQRIGKARPWLEVLFEHVGLASFDPSHTNAEWLDILMQHATHRLPAVVACLPANEDARALVLISRRETQLAASFSPVVPTANREAHGQVVAWAGLIHHSELDFATCWNGAWTPKAGHGGKAAARQLLAAILAQLQPLTGEFVGTFGQLLASPVAALDPLLSARAAPLDQGALERDYGRLVATRARLAGLALASNPSPETLAVLGGAFGGPRPTDPRQMLLQGEVWLAHFVRQLADSRALGTEAYEVLAPPEVSICGLGDTGLEEAAAHCHLPSFCFGPTAPPHPGVGCCVVVGPCSDGGGPAARGGGDACRGGRGPAAV